MFAAAHLKSRKLSLPSHLQGAEPENKLGLGALVVYCEMCIAQSLDAARSGKR
jgi:hypothetical protein